MMNIHKGDTVQIRAGKDRGKTGKIIKVNLKGKAVLVEGVNLYKKHVRPKRQGEKGEIVTLPQPIHISKVMVYCSNCRRGVRVGGRLEGEGRRTRYCKRCKVSL